MRFVVRSGQRFGDDGGVPKPVRRWLDTGEAGILMSNAALISQRAAGLPGNPFAEADARVAAAIAAGEDVIDLSKGNPDGQPPAFVQDALAHAAHDPSLFRYPSFDGLPEYLNAIAGWYESKHGVSVDPATQLLATSGSSVGIATVIQALWVTLQNVYGGRLARWICGWECRSVG